MIPIPLSNTANVNNSPTSAFQNLHKFITEQVLDHDNSTRSKNHQYEVSGTAARLHEAHVTRATNAITLRALRDLNLLDSKDVRISEELRQLCHVVSAYLVSVQAGLLEVNEEVETLMADEIAEFRENLPEIAKAVGKHVLDIEDTVIKMLQPLVQPPESTRPKPDETKSSKIPAVRSTTTTATTRTYKPTITQPTTHTSSATTIQTLREQETHLQTIHLPHALTSLLTTLTALLTAQSTLLTSQLRHAELHTHSTKSRYVTSHATFLSSVAQGLDLKCQILALQREKEVYAAQGVQGMLRGKWEGLKGEEVGLREREERLEGLLGEFRDAEIEGGVGRGTRSGAGVGGGGGGGGGGGEGVFEKLGRGYAEVEAEIEVVRADVERLERELLGVGVGRGGGAREGRGRGFGR